VGFFLLFCFFFLFCWEWMLTEWLGDRHLAARFNQVEELSMIVDMVGVGCLEVENDEESLPFDPAMDCSAWDVASYIDDVNLKQTKGTRR
jgi:hypothetical protein